MFYEQRKKINWIEKQELKVAKTKKILKQQKRKKRELEKKVIENKFKKIFDLFINHHKNFSFEEIEEIYKENLEKIQNKKTNFSTEKILENTKH